MWTSINNWCTPTILFLFLNFMIATILFTSNLPNNNNTNTNNQNKQQNQKTQTQNEPNKLARSPSILNRIRSFNLHAYRSQNDQHHPIQQVQEEQDGLELAATQYVFDHPFPDQQDPQPQSQPIPVSSKPDLDPIHYDQTNEVQPQSQPISNAQTHFVYDRHTIERITTHYDFGPTHIENQPPEPTHLGSDQKSIENKQEKKTHFKFDPTHLDKTQEKLSHIENEPKNTTRDDFDPTHEEEQDTLQSLDEVYSNITGGHVNRTKSDTLPASGEVPVKLPAKMKKSASMKSPFSHFEEEKIVEARRPETVRERRTAVTDGDDDVEVDAKADDFINKFKHQLKLQRLDSIIRSKDMMKVKGWCILPLQPQSLR
nr:hypothetical protein [Tanacetum cinerariifolium]